MPDHILQNYLRQSQLHSNTPFTWTAYPGIIIQIKSGFKVTIVLCFVIFVCTEIGRADGDERKELINSLSGSYDVHLDGNPQGAA